MANNQNVNKVMFGAATIIDISPTTAVESDVANGKVFFKADGSQAVGTKVGLVNVVCNNVRSFFLPDNATLNRDTVTLPADSAFVIAVANSTSATASTTGTVTTNDIATVLRANRYFFVKPGASGGTFTYA